MKKTLSVALGALALGFASLGAHAASTTLDTGLIQMGVADNAGLGAGTGGAFIGLVGPTGDAITPGCLCEGWGAAAGGASGYVYGLGGTGITSALTTTTVASGAGLSAQSVVIMSNGLQVTHTYSYAAGGVLFRVAVEIKNTTAGTVSDVRYARTLDWDVTPGYFGGNYTTVYGGTPAGPGGKVLHTSTNPFFAPDPMQLNNGGTFDANVTNEAGDLGGYFVFGFGDLAAGASTTFDTYIGASRTIAGLLAALGSVGVEAYSFTTGNGGTGCGTGGACEPAYGYGFVGLGLPPSLPPGDVPEPGSLMLLGLGLAGMGFARRRKA